MPSKKLPDRVLVISLSNVGDVFLTVPVVHQLHKAYPRAALHLLVGTGTEGLFRDDPRVQEVIVYDKKMPLQEKWRFVRRLRGKRFDLVIDLRNTLFPLLLNAPRHTPVFARPPRDFTHRIERHLWKLTTVGIPVTAWRDGVLPVRDELEKRLERRFSEFGLRFGAPFLLVSPGSKSDLKKWPAASFAALSDRLSREKKLPILFTGEENDRPFVGKIVSAMRERAFSLAGETSLPELIALVRRAKLLVTNDNATLHVASLLNVPTAAIFGPTDPGKYGPKAERHRVVRKDLFCSPCEKARCPYRHECMEALPVEEVYQACCDLLLNLLNSRRFI